jgi:hypothetical protein
MSQIQGGDYGYDGDGDGDGNGDGTPTVAQYAADDNLPAMLHCITVLNREDI